MYLSEDMPANKLETISIPQHLYPFAQEYNLIELDLIRDPDLIIRCIPLSQRQKGSYGQYRQSPL